MHAHASQPTRPARRRTRLRVIAGLLIIGLGCWLLIERHFSNLAYFVIVSESMEPTLRIGDRVVMEKPAVYHRGDVVVLEKPDEPETVLVKRIVAMAGDEVRRDRSDLKVTLHAPHEPPSTAPPRVPDNNYWRIKPGEVFVAGDNRPNSDDSRAFGPVPLESLRGVVRYRIESLFKWERVR